MTAVIRDENPADVGAIEALTAAAFLDAPHSSHTEHFIVNALRNAGALTLSLVAEEKGEVIGHVAVSPVTISDGTTRWLGLGPISVLPAYQRRGIGAQLMEAVLARLIERGAAGCVLLGDPEYYARFGFRCESSLILPGVPQEYFQAVAFQSIVPIGTVSYHEAFDAKP